MKTTARVAAAFSAACLLLPASALAQARIVGGSKAPGNTYRWIVALANTTGGDLFDRQFCGASLISQDWVLTAAHCVEGETASRLQVVVGLTDLDDTSGAEIRGVRGIYTHPGFTDVQGDLFNDLALLLLDTPITTITPITYARTPSDTPPGTSVRALGWGDTQANPRYPTELRMVDLNIVNISVARQAYGVNSLDNRHLAAMANGKDTCGGDSGGPLFDVDGDSGNPLLAGITSYGLDCAQPGVPGIYTNVGNYKSFIDTFLAQPLTGNPQIAVTGRGRTIPNPSPRASTLNGTDFGRPLRAGRSRIHRFPVSNAAGGIPLSLSNVRTVNRHFTVVAAPTYLFGGESRAIAVRFRAPSGSRSRSTFGRLYIHSNDPVNPAFAITLRGRYLADSWWF